MNAIGTTERTFQPVAEPGRFRLLGEDLAPPRANYLTYIPLFLAFAGLITWIVGDEIAMVISASVASLIALYALLDWLFRSGATRFSSLMAMTLLLGYGLGTLNTWLTLPRGGITLSAYWGASEGVLARAMAAVLLSAASLFFFGEMYERPIFGREFRIPLDERTRRLIYFGTLAVVIGFATHQMQFDGAVVGEGGELSIYSSFLIWFFSPITALAVAVAVASRPGKAKLLTGISALILLVMLVALGRRALIYTSMEIIFALRFTGYKPKGSILKKTILVLTVGVFIVLGALSFMLLRLASGPTGKASLLTRITTAIGWVEEGTALSQAIGATQSNVQTRTFVLAFFADTLEGSSQRTPALGRDAIGLSQLAIPSAIYPGKDKYFSEEGLVDNQFGLTYPDAPNSILTAGAADFGFVGVILYPLIIVWITRNFIEFFSNRLPSGPALIVTLSLIYQMLQTENDIQEYLLAIRGAILFSIGLLLIFSLPSFRLRH